ncbi:MAG: NrtA/SsuA/CpmA family ABC transporter substrate-binding protein [Peptococcaceae bacterium]|nr:NrtA/SsuA/CpmA family ABC transporter substrate-binding protein [Peptococcaceae bacterium]
MRLNSFFLIMVSFLLVVGFCLGTGCAGSQEKPLTELRVSFASRPINAPSIVAIEKGILEERFAREGISVVWHELAGAEISEALASGRIDIATSFNSLSVLIAKAAGIDIKIMAGFSQFPEAIGLVAAENVGSMEDLRGGKVAVTKGTMLHEMIVKALAEAGMTADDVEVVNLDSPDALAALIGGHVDAAVLPEPLLSKALASGNAALLRTAEGLILGQTVIAARSAFLEKYPDLAELFLQAHDACLDYMAVHEEEVLMLCAAAVDMPPESVRALYPKFSFAARLEERDILAMKASVAFLKEQHIINTDVSADALLEQLTMTMDNGQWTMGTRDNGQG